MLEGFVVKEPGFPKQWPTCLHGDHLEFVLLSSLVSYRPNVSLSHTGPVFSTSAFARSKLRLLDAGPHLVSLRMPHGAVER